MEHSLTDIRPKLRGNLRYTVQTFGKQSYYVLEDPLREHFWRIGALEFQLLSALDGQKTVGQLLHSLSEPRGTGGLSKQEAESVVTWSIREGLCENLSSQKREPVSRKWSKLVNQFAFYRLSFGNPQPLFAWLFRCLGWLTSPWLLTAWGLFLASAALSLVPRWESFATASFTVIAPELWWQLLCIWWGLKLVHELSHGLTCVRYGGHVSQAGILFLLCAPLGAFVDVTSAWRLSKWKRIHVSLAGIIAELCIAAAAIHGWCLSTHPLVQQVCLQTFLLASVSTILFNGNPLIRFDGYYVLADLLEIPNLYQRGQLAVRQAFQRIFLGTQPAVPIGSRDHRGFVFCFGLATTLWRFLLGIAIVLGASLLFSGAGLAFALVLGVTWFVVPIVQLCWSIVKQVPKHPLRVARAGVLAAASLALLFLALQTISIPRRVIAPGVVCPLQSSLLRAAAPGKVVRVAVAPGESVVEGQLLLEIENPELALEVLRLRQELRRQETRHLRLIHESKTAELHAETVVQAELENQLATLQSELDKLQVKAPHAGVVKDFSLDQIRGARVRRGDPLLELADLSASEFRFSLDQHAHDGLRRTPQAAIATTLYMPGYAPVRLDAADVELFPRAQWELELEALAASNGGPIAVQEVRGERRTIHEQALSPQLLGKVHVGSQAGFVPGSVGRVAFTLSRESLADRLRPGLEQWLRETAGKLRLAELLASLRNPSSGT